MSLVHVTATRTSLADVVGDQLDSGDCVFTLANGTTEVATVSLGAAAFPASADGSTTWANSPQSDSSATGNASPVALYLMKTSGDAEVFRGSVTATGGGGDIELSSLTVAVGDTVTLSSYSYAASA